MSETEKKGWFARFRSRGTPASETPQSAEPSKSAEPPKPAEPPQSAASENENQAETLISPPSSESPTEVPDSFM